MQFTPSPYVSQVWNVTKPAARGHRGLVVAQARDAAEAGVAVLDAGGNAVDAAVATAFALAAAEPWNSGFGGIGYAVVHPAGEARAQVVDFGPVAPRALDPSAFRLTGRTARDLFGWPEVERDANIHGPLSFAIPSAVAGYGAMHERWGRLPFVEIVDPAIALARRGLPLDWFTTLKVAGAASILRLYAESARIYLPDGLPPPPPQSGPPDFRRLGRLPESLERIRHAGWRDFYDGDLAEALAADILARGGVIDRQDLRRCTARIGPASEVAAGDLTMQLPGRLTAAPTLARAVALMGEDFRRAEPDAVWFASLARALRAAYGERLAGMGEAEPAGAPGCTTHVTVCDADGGMVALTTTLLSSMGSRMVLPGTGVLMNNGIMWFDPRPGRPNSLAPTGAHGERRPLTNMCPLILRDAGGPLLAAGGSGGRKILPAVLQLVAFVAGFGMGPEAAGHHPRIDVSGGDSVTADRRLPDGILSALEADAAVERVENTAVPANFACANLIAIGPDGTRTGISDAMSPWSAALAQA